MKINISSIETNGKKIYLHDSDMISLKQNMDEQELEIIFINNYENITKRARVKFSQTMFFELTNYTPWGNGSQVHGFSFEEPSLYERLMEISHEFGEGYEINQLMERDRYIQPVITFRSGDKLRVLCSEIDIEEESLR